MALAAGPKKRTGLKPLPQADDAVGLVELVTGQPLYEWQRPILRDLTAPRRPRVAYIQVARKQGKTRLAAAVALAEMLQRRQRHVYAIADSERNLKSVFLREMRDIIGGSELLRDSVHQYHWGFEVPETGSFLEVRPSNFRATQGINPHLVIFDEVHLQTSDQIWSGMQMAGAARADALLLGITTPGYDLTSMAHGLYQEVRAGSARLYGRVFEPADPDCDILDRDAWLQANPVLAEGRPGFAEALEYDLSLPEHEFRRFRLGLWTATETAWLPYGAWEACADRDRGEPDDGERVWLGFDGSYSNDSTALVGCTEDGHVFVAGCWENPGRKGWRVPREEVEAAVLLAFARWRVEELQCDPPYWEREIAEWGRRWGTDRVMDFPTASRARMAPATTALHAAVMDGALTHDGDPRLARHVSNCVVKTSPQGDVITKADKNSPAKIDLAVAAAIAYLHAVRAAPRRSDLFVA
jgi:phage terminase large subunit-like protein